MQAQSSAGGKTAPPLLLIAVLAIISVSLAAPSAALAHNVSVHAYVEGDEMITESRFSDGKECQDATIEVFDGKGNKLAEGKTDAQGLFSFRPPARTDLVIRLTTAMGHRAEYTVLAQDLRQDLPENLPENLPHEHETPETGGKVAEDPHGHAHPEPEHDPPAGSPGLEHHGSAEIELIVDRVVSQRLAPMRRDLEEARRERRLSDIIGGIGYIVGLMGLAMYFRSRLKLGR
jgi:nickel transport protein